MVHRITWRVGSEDALAFWAERLGAEDVPAQRAGARLRFADPEGLELELAVVETTDAPLTAEHPEIPEELRLQGFDGVRAFSLAPDASRLFLDTAMGFRPSGRPRSGRRAATSAARSTRTTGRRPSAGSAGRGTVHHVAWAAHPEEHEAWRERIARAGGNPTPVIDRFYFKSIYFREPSGVLFEIATLGPGFAADEPLETLGEALSLPPNFEPLREQLADVLTPLPNPRESWTRQ